MRFTLAALAALATSAASPAPSPSPLAAAARRQQQRHYTPEDRERGRYQYVPIVVPPGTTRLTIAYSYDKAGGTNVVDLGLFEPGPLDLGARAFRGWSGGSRSEVTIRPGEATPGYWPGPLPPGEWHVLLGLYKVAPAGVDVVVTTETSSDADPAPTPPLAPRPTGAIRKGPGWYSGGLHLHTVHSDGRHTTAEVCRLAREAGLDFVVITDHNNTTHQLDPVEEPDLLRIVGEEVTTPGGHASVWGLGGWRDEVDFRVIAGDERIKDLVRAATERGALVAINHPRAECLGCSWEHAIPPGVSAVEVTDAGRGGAGAIALWDTLLQRGRRVVGIGSSDWHAPDHPIGTASVRVFSRELSQAAVLEGIAAGRVVIMADGRTPPPILIARGGGREAQIGDTLTVERGGSVSVELATPDVWAGGRVDLVWDGVVVDSAPVAAGRPARFQRPVAKDGYLRAHVQAADGSPLAVTNPVFVTMGTAK